MPLPPISNSCGFIKIGPDLRLLPLGSMSILEIATHGPAGMGLSQGKLGACY